MDKVSRGVYLLMIDYGLKQLAGWRELCAETAVAVAEELEKVILEQDPVAEVIMDNCTVFCLERGGITPIVATFWYNMVLKVSQREETVPQWSIFTYKWKNLKNKFPDVDEEGLLRIHIGKKVWVKPPSTLCKMQ